MSSAFDGLRVLDVSSRLSGAFAGRLFGDFGADVLLAEPPDGHPLRSQGPFLDDLPGPDRSFLHAFANWNKHATALRVTEDLSRLVASADLVITNLGPGDFEPGGMAIRPALARLRPDAVHLDISPHGLSGPLATAPGTHLTACARTGWAQANHYQGEPPLQLPRDQTGYVAGLAGFVAAAAALLGRAEREGPEAVSVSEAEALALTIHPWGIAAIYNGQGFSNAAGGRPRGAPHPLWDLADGRMHFAISDFHNWTEAMEALGLPELARREDLIPDLGRHSQDLTEVAVAMVESLKRLNRWSVFERLAELRCPVGVVQTLDELVKNPHLVAREFLVETEVDGRRLRAPGAPAKHSASPWALRRPAPRLDGESRDWTTSPRPAARARPLEAPSREGPLAGVRVLSFGQAWSGTFGTEVLSLLGANVVQIGSRHRPDVWRRVSGTVPKAVARPDREQHPLNTQGLYNSVNLNKRELALDLRDDRGRDLFWRLLPRFDVLVDNFRPTVMPGWGVTLERLHHLRPGMIWASVSGYGATGPYARYPANGSTTEPMSGLSSIHGYAGDSGMNTGGLFPDPVSGYFLAASVIAALHARDRTGEPQRVDLSMMEAVSVLCGEAILEGQARGRAPVPAGNRHPLMTPHGCYPAHAPEGGEEWIAIAVTDDAAWEALVSEAGEAGLQDPRFIRFEDRRRFEAEIDRLLADWTRRQDAAGLEARLLTRGVAAARVVPLYEIYDRPDPNFVATGFITRIHHPEVGPTWLPGRPWRFASGVSAPLRPSPCVGEHSREILLGELGLTEAEYAGLVAAGVTGSLTEGP